LKASFFRQQKFCSEFGDAASLLDKAGRLEINLFSAAKE